MKTLTKDMKIFSYRTEPLNGMEGDDGGFSIELYGNGNLRYCIYRLFDDIRLLQMFKVSKEAVYDIYGIIEKATKRLEQLTLTKRRIIRNRHGRCFLGLTARMPDLERLQIQSCREQYIMIKKDRQRRWRRWLRQLEQTKRLPRNMFICHI